MDQTASELRQELDRKRNELTRDVDRIEEKVKSSFDLNKRIDESPLLAVGLSVVGGFLLGNMVGGGKKQPGSGSGSHTYASGGYPSSAFYSGASTPGPYWSGASSYGTGGQWSQPSQPTGQGNGPGIVGEVKEGLKESFRRGSGTSVDDALTNITAALTAVLMDKAKEMLDRNLPGFANRYEQVAHTGDAPMSGAGMGQQGSASGYATGGQATPSPYSSTAGQASHAAGERAGSPATATTAGGASTVGGSSGMGAGRSSSTSAADFRDATTRDAGMRDPN